MAAEKTKKRQLLHLLLVSSLLLTLTACATPAGKVQVAEKFAENSTLPSLKLAILPLNGTKEGAKFFREILHAHLMDSGLNITEKFIVDGIIKKNTWNTPEKLFTIPPQKLGEALGVDALLYGKVTKWNKYYAIIHSTLVVGLELKLVDARTGELLWKGEQVDRDYEGLVKIPTGIISAVINPIAFVGEKKNLISLASKVARDITVSLRNPHTIKEKNKMKQTIVIASADEYMKKIEGKSPPPNEDSAKGMFAKNDLPSLEEATSDFIKTAQLTEEEIELPKPEIRPEYPDRRNAMTFPSRSLKKNRTRSTGKKLTIIKPPNNSQHIKNIYTIQVGAFQSQNHAKSLIKELKGKGYNPFIAMARIGKEVFYKVQIDRFKDKSKAIIYAKRLEQKEKLPYFITKAETAPPA